MPIARAEPPLSLTMPLRLISPRKLTQLIAQNMSNFRGAAPKDAKFGKSASAQSAPIDLDRLPPIFSFEHMRAGNGYSVDCCDAEHRAALAARLFKLSQMTWLNIKNSPRHGLGTEKIARSSIRAPIPQKVTEDASLLALRYNGKAAMVGYRDGRVFYVVFLDHTFDLYSHG